MERLTSGALRELLEQAGPALTSGSANVISVAAIRDGSGDRWARKREQVAEFVARAFQRANSGGGLVTPLSEIEYLVLHADTTRWAALNLSAGILRETLSYFLGQAEPQHVRLMEVTGFSNGELAVRSVDPTCLASEDPDVVGRASSSTEPSPPWSPQLLGAQAAGSLHLNALGLEVEVSHALQPTWNIRNRAVTSFLVETLTSPRLDLSPMAAAEVARSSLTIAAEQLVACCAAGAPVALHVPIPIGALTVQTGRHGLISTLKGLPREARRLLVLELTDVADGVPQGRLSEAIAMLTPHARAILARAPNEWANLVQWRRCGLNGITLDCSAIEASDRQAQSRLSSFARNVLSFAPACVGYSLRETSLLVSAWAAGFTHVGGDAVSRRVSELAGVRLPPAELYGLAAA